MNDLALVESWLRGLDHRHLVLSLLSGHVPKRLIDSLFRSGSHPLPLYLLLKGILQDFVFGLKVFLADSLLHARCESVIVLNYELLLRFHERLRINFMIISLVKIILIYNLLIRYIRLFHESS